MFWIHKTYEIPSIDKTCELRMQEFANKNAFQFQAIGLNQQYTFIQSNRLKLKNLFSIHLQLRPSLSASQKQALVKLRPSLWLLVFMGVLMCVAVVGIIDDRWRSSLGISLPLLFVVPYIYRLYAHKILSELKNCLITGFEHTSEGRKETYTGYTKPLRLFLNFQLNAYILFVVVLITIMILWMLGVTDRFFQNP